MSFGTTSLTSGTTTRRSSLQLCWFAADGSYVGLQPARLVDTRPVPTAPPPPQVTQPPTTPPPATQPPTTPTGSSVPGNPGDVRNCSDFATQAAAHAWYDTYAPYYGDVAHLDSDGDGIACESLP